MNQSFNHEEKTNYFT